MGRYDYLIVGAGLFGAVFAREAVRAGKKVLVVDKTYIIEEIIIFNGEVDYGRV